MSLPASRVHPTGRKKTATKLIQSEKARQVTFSKRRKGVFNKANELSTLTGAKVALITFSESGKVYSFCNPRQTQHGYVNLETIFQHLKEQCNQEKEELKRNNQLLEKFWQELLSGSEAQNSNSNTSGEFSLTQLQKLVEKVKRFEEQIASININLANIQMDNNDKSQWLRL